MFEKVLIPTDFSKHSRRMLNCIIGIHGIREIILLHVIEKIPAPLGKERVEASLKDAAEKSLLKEKQYLDAMNSNIRVTSELTISSDAAGTILDIAEKNSVDLIVLSTYGFGIKTGVVIGNVQTSVVCRISRINILIIRHKILKTLIGKAYEKFCPMIFSRILCPTDFSEYSVHAINLVASIQGIGEVILLHVVPQEGTKSQIKESVRAANLEMEAIRDTLVAKGIRSRAIIKTGDPASEITRTAEEENVSVIWISSYGKGCFRDFLLGSTVSDVVMKTNHPVLIIRSLN
jgi:nucleotide-binding universal stress UspA family protein